MTNIKDLLPSCHVFHVMEHGREIKLPHLVPGEPPENLLVWVQSCVVPAVHVATKVTEPDIIASISQQEACERVSYEVSRRANDRRGKGRKRDTWVSCQEVEVWCLLEIIPLCLKYQKLSSCLQ